MKKSAFLPVIALLLAIGLMNFRNGSDGYKVGDTVQDFKLKNIDGKTVSLADNKDTKGYIIAFTCNTCPVAKAYESRIIALNEQFASKGYLLSRFNRMTLSVHPAIRMRPCSSGRNPAGIHFRTCTTIRRR